MTQKNDVWLDWIAGSLKQGPVSVGARRENFVGTKKSFDNIILKHNNSSAE